MTYDSYRYIFIGATILCLVMFLVSVLLFIVFKIPKVINDLSGRTAKKAIENIRSKNEKTGEKAYKVDITNKNRGKITDKISNSGNLIPKNKVASNLGFATSKISTQTLDSNGTSNAFTETTLLSTTSETTVLSQETSVLNNSFTTVLNDDTKTQFNESQTVVLNDFDMCFAVVSDTTFIHTDERVV